MAIWTFNTLCKIFLPAINPYWAGCINFGKYFCNLFAKTYVNILYNPPSMSWIWSRLWAILHQKKKGKTKFEIYRHRDTRCLTWKPWMRKTTGVHKLWIITMVGGIHMQQPCSSSFDDDYNKVTALSLFATLKLHKDAILSISIKNCPRCIYT